LYKPATYNLEIEVEAETPEQAKVLALAQVDLGVLDWDYGDPGGDIEVNAVVDLEKEDIVLRAWFEERQQKEAKEVRIVAVKFSAILLSDRSPVYLVPGDALTKVSRQFGNDQIEFDSRLGRCTITERSLHDQTGRGSYGAFPPEREARK